MSFFQNTCKPEGFWGARMVELMNAGHTFVSAWGLSHLELPADAACLDIGCGGGVNVKRLLKKNPRGTVVGIDYSEVSVEKSKRCNRAAIHAQCCQILHGNVMALPFSDAAFDAATAFETIYFWPDLAQAFAQVQRVLKPGGIFLLCNEMDGEHPGDDIWTHKIHGMKLYTAPQLQTLLESAGFIDVQTDKNKSGWLCMTCRKPQA